MRATSLVLDQAPDIRESLSHFNSVLLDDLYASGEAVPLPTGLARTIALPFPDSGFTPVLSVATRAIWQGMSVDADQARLVNRVLGFSVVPARIYEGESWFDDRAATIVDHAETSATFRNMRDEIRRIADGLFLGRTYYRSGSNPRGRFLMNFVMDYGQRA
jgi:hypothetical protein